MFISKYLHFLIIYCNKYKLRCLYLNEYNNNLKLAHLMTYFNLYVYIVLANSFLNRYCGIHLLYSDLIACRQNYLDDILFYFIVYFVNTVTFLSLE